MPSPWARIDCDQRVDRRVRRSSPLGRVAWPVIILELKRLDGALSDEQAEPEEFADLYGGLTTDQWAEALSGFLRVGLLAWGTCSWTVTGGASRSKTGWTNPAIAAKENGPNRKATILMHSRALTPVNDRYQPLTTVNEINGPQDRTGHTGQDIQNNNNAAGAADAWKAEQDETQQSSSDGEQTDTIGDIEPKRDRKTPSGQLAADFGADRGSGHDRGGEATPEPVDAILARWDELNARKSVRESKAREDFKASLRDHLKRHPAAAVLLVVEYLAQDPWWRGRGNGPDIDLYSKKPRAWAKHWTRESVAKFNQLVEEATDWSENGAPAPKQRGPGVPTTGPMYMPSTPIYAE